jgi:hypothetical protein
MKKLKGLDLKKSESYAMIGSKFNNPEVLITLLSVFFLVLMLIISGIEIEGVELAAYEHNQFDDDGNVTITRSFETW